MTGILWGLCAALFIGGSDCIARVTAQRVSVVVLFLIIMGLSLATLSVWLFATDNWPPWDAHAWAASAVSGLLNLVALYFLYKALAHGPVAVASPAASTFTVLLVAFNVLNGEPWSWLQVVAIVIVFAGVAMLTLPTDADKNKKHYDARWLQRTALLGLAAALAVAFRMFLAQEAGSALGAMHALYLNRAFAMLGAVVLLAVCLTRRQQLVWPTGGMKKLVILQAIFETAALAFFLIGSANGGRITATIGFSVFAAATAVFAWIWLAEPIGWQRGGWILLIGFGIMLAVVGNPT
ncbi:MAG: EamA family transporter [Granulosicoccus sp.]